MPGVELVTVANRSRPSSEVVARTFGFAEVSESWEPIMARPDVDAVFIGTWPYMHHTLSIAALEAGKHVFCQARMASGLAEALAMREAARRRPELVAMVCPAPCRLPFEPWFRDLVAGERLGPITSVELVSRSGANLDPRRVTWRERVEYSGKNILQVGIYAEMLNAWFGPVRRLTAQLATPVPVKHDEEGHAVRIGVPQVATVTAELEGGGILVEQHSGLAADPASRAETLTLFGLRGTVRHRLWSDELEIAHAGEDFAPAEVPAALRSAWRAEEDFIAAVHAARAGTSWRVDPDFEDGLRYMRKIEAIHRSAATGRAVAPAEL
jgi:predicted dehydrogenase